MTEVIDNIHMPVMMREVLTALALNPGNFVIDGTFGGGGHAERIINDISPDGIFLGVDRDPLAIRNSHINNENIKIILVNANYALIPDILNDYKLPLADALLLDLGFSSNQLNNGRGFSFMKDEPLLMTYSDDDEPLYSAIRRLNKKELQEIISISGERYARVIAEAIWEAKRKYTIGTTGELVNIIQSVVPPSYERGRIHRATRTFLAFRIYINKELENLEKIIDSLPQILKPGGRAVIITFQSLEDRLIKHKFREMNKERIVSLQNKKPISPEYLEIKENPRARSAKLRAIIMN